MTVEDDRGDFVGVSDEKPLLASCNVHLNEQGVGSVENEIVVGRPEKVLFRRTETDHSAKAKYRIGKKDA